MGKIIAINQTHDIIKKIRKNDWVKEDTFVVDDLFALSLDETKNSKIVAVIFCETLLFSEEAKALQSYYVSKIDVAYSVSEKVYATISEKENCAGLTVILKKKSLALQDTLAKSSFVLVNDGIEQSGNLGTIFRTADAVGVDLVINTNIKASVYQPKVLHASRGMVLKVPFINAGSREVMAELLAQGYTIYLCEPEDGVPFDQVDYQGKIAIVIGCERFGIAKEWFEGQHKNIMIPMFGTMTSLNVGVAGSIILYQAKLKRK